MEDFPPKCGQKRCVKMARLNLSVLPKATIDIQNASILNGYLPNRQLKLVLAWCVLYQDELMQDWELVKAGREPNPIPPMIRR